MTVRSVFNNSIKMTTRSVRSIANDMYLSGVAHVENNGNIQGADLSAPAAIYFKGHDHIPSTKVQYDLNAT